MAATTLRLRVMLASVLLATNVAAEEPARRIGWSDLPAVSANADPGSAAAASPGSAAGPALAGETIRLDGFLLPVDLEGDLVHEFLLVPWAGACSHTPPPPPGQILHVFPAKPYRLSAMFEPVTITGSLVPGRAMVQVFIRDGVAIIPADFTVDRAGVVHSSEKPADARSASPWPFLRE